MFTKNNFKTFVRFARDLLWLFVTRPELKRLRGPDLQFEPEYEFLNFKVRDEVRTRWF